jgi:hypothetical protein
MVKSVRNSPAVVQYVIFNEQDCIGTLGQDFGLEMFKLIKQLDPSRLVDVHSGAAFVHSDATDPAKDVDALGDVHDAHHYPDPEDPGPRSSQYSMVTHSGV